MPDTPADATRESLARWLAAAEADADARGLPELKPLLQGLADVTAALRAADWNDRADQQTAPSAPQRDQE